MIIDRKEPDGVFDRTASCGPYTVTNCASGDLSGSDVDRCVAMIPSGGAVDP